MSDAWGSGFATKLDLLSETPNHDIGALMKWNRVLGFLVIFI